MASNTSKITLHIDNQVFQLNREVLIEHSDYFRAMFSGNFCEEDKKEITIDMVDANSMNIIVRYMQLGLLDLNEYPLAVIGDLAISANFLQITELMKQIEFCLELNLSLSNWIATMTIAENAFYKKLLEQCAAFGLYQFKDMKPEHIQPVQKLVWYLSHKYINVESELDIFKFGVSWISYQEAGCDVLLLILGCLDMSRLTKEDLSEMKLLIKDYVNSLPEKVIDCLYKLATDYKISETAIKNNKTALCEMFTERVYTETLNIVVDSSKRQLKLKICVGLWSKEEYVSSRIMSNWLYMFNENGFTKWLQVADKDLWGWNIVAWGTTKIVVVCGEHGKGTGVFWRNVKVYDILRKEWTEHLVNLPVRRHGGVAIIKDSLYIIGGVGGYRVILDTAVVYNLKERSWRHLPKFPQTIQSPAVCVHEGRVYAAGERAVYYLYNDQDNIEWVKATNTEILISSMVSFKGYIYCTQNYFPNFYRFKPGVDGKLELLTSFNGCPATVCQIGDGLLVFTSTNCTQGDMVTVEKYNNKINNGQPKVLWSKQNCIYTINNVAGNCAIVDSIPSVQNEISQYLKRCLANYEACHSN